MIGREQREPDEVDETSDESFPASDAPAWTTVTGAHAELQPPPDSAAITITHDEAGHRFETRTSTGVALLRYRRRRDGALVLIHTQVPPALEGRGIAGRLARAALEYARANGLVVEVVCPFVAAYIERHPEFRDLVR